MMQIYNFPYFQYIFSLIGWLVSHVVWSQVRGDSVSSDPDITNLADFLLSDQTATNNVALGFSYVSHKE